MSPQPLWFDNRDDIGRFLDDKMVPDFWSARVTSANTQPAVALYVAGPDGVRLESLHVFSFAPDGIARIVVFRDSAALAPFAMSSD